MTIQQCKYILKIAETEFIRYANQMVEQSDYILERYSSCDLYQRLYVCTQHYDFVADIFCKLLNEIKEEHYKFSLREMKTYDVIQATETARCDIGIIAIKDNDYKEICRTFRGNSNHNLSSSKLKRW